MLLHIRDTISDQRKKILPSAIALALIAGVIVSILASSNAQASYANGCGYGYSSTGTSGYSSNGSLFQYGYLADGSFGYGYGSTVCSLQVNTTVPGGTAGVPYSAQLTGSGGVTPYTWSWSGTPSDGLSISSSGLITGVPSYAGTFMFTVTMTDANGQSATGTVTIPIASSSGGGGGGGTTTTTTTSTTTTTAPTTTTTAPTTTTTAPATTTTAPATTTTAPAGKSHRFFCHGVHGFGMPGRTLTMNVFGSGFFAQPKLTSNEFGTRFGVLHDRGNVLVTHVTVRGGSRLGWHTLTLRLANGRTCKANYLVKK